MEPDAALMHESFATAWERLYAAAGGRFERRADLIALSCARLPVPQANGAWVVEDSEAAAAALPQAIEEAEALGVPAWVQTRPGHERTRRVAAELGLTHVELVPAMVIRPDELAPSESTLEIDVIAEDDVERTVAILATAFEAPHDLFDWFGRLTWSLEGASWYVGRVGDEIVSTAVGYTYGPATGVFNVATPPEHRGRGYGAALTARCVQDGFDAGAELAYLQSSELGHGVYRRLGFRDVDEYVLLARPV